MHARGWGRAGGQEGRQARGRSVVRAGGRACVCLCVCVHKHVRRNEVQAVEIELALQESLHGLHLRDLKNLQGMRQPPPGYSMIRVRACMRMHTLRSALRFALASLTLAYFRITAPTCTHMLVIGTACQQTSKVDSTRVQFCDGVQVPTSGVCSHLPTDAP